MGHAQKSTRDVVKLGQVPVGDGHPPVLMAEIGTFFNNDIDLAIKYLCEIADTDAQVFKTEILHDPDICLKDSGLRASYCHASGISHEDYRALIERKVVPLDEYARLFAMSRQLDMPFVCSVYDLPGIDFLLEQQCAGIKFARDNITNIGLIQYAARTGIPLILDAGNLYLSELSRAVEAARAAGAKEIIINHHPAANPAPAEQHHLRVIETYKRIFNVPVGLSCHFQGEEILYAAVACGANILEKGIDSDPERAEQDIISAAPLSDLPQILSRIKNCWLALGSDIWPIQEPRNQDTWKGLVARQDIASGEIIDLATVGFSFPVKGVPVSHWDIVAGALAAHDIAKGQPVSWSDILLDNAKQNDETS